MLLIGGGSVVTRNETGEVIQKGAVLIKGQTILAVGEEAQLKKQYRQYDYIDAQGGLIMPGYINTHHHSYSAFARGLSIPGNVPHNFLEILEGTWWRLDRHLTSSQIVLSAKATFVDCLKRGVTTVFDHHASYGSIEGSLFSIGKVAQALGMRACLAYEVSDREGKDKMKAAVRENKDFIQYAQTNQQLCGMIGLHASFTLSDETLDYVKAQTPKGAGYHIHVGEGLSDALHCEKHYGKSIVSRLKEAGILGPQTLAAHCIHINEADLELLKQTRTMVVHNPESNMGNAVGAAAIQAFFNQGILIGLGTDGYTSDLLESMKVAQLLQKHEMKDPSVGGVEAPEMLFKNNPKIAHRFFKQPIGVLEEGAYGDVIIVDYKPFTPLTAENINSHLLFGVSGTQTKTTIIGGKVLMQDGKLLQVDEEALSRQCQEAAQKLWQSL